MKVAGQRRRGRSLSLQGWDFVSTQKKKVFCHPKPVAPANPQTPSPTQQLQEQRRRAHTLVCSLQLVLCPQP